MLDAYFGAFDDFLRTGNPEPLGRFTDADTDPAVLRVYRNGYLKTCSDALAAGYPVVRALVGEDCFRGLARAYVEAHPPTTGTLVAYGGHFGEFLRSRSNVHQLAYLPDAAALDAAWLVSHFAADGVALTAADVESMAAQGVDVSAVRVGLTPPTQLVSLKHDFVATWTLIREHGALQERIDLRQAEQSAMLWRRGGRIHVKALDPGESVLLSTLAAVATLETAATRAYQADPSFDLATTFAALLQNRILQLESQNE